MLDSVRCQQVTFTHALWSVNNVAVKFFGKNFTISIVHYMASTSLITLQLTGLLKQSLILMHVNFAKDLKISRVLKFLFLRRYQSCILWSLLNMAQLEFYKNFHSMYKDIMIFRLNLLSRGLGRLKYPYMTCWMFNTCF